MKKTIFFLLALASACLGFAQKTNDNPDAIVGRYRLVQSGVESRVRVMKLTNGTYRAQVYWVKDSIDPSTGKLVTDVKNPDKSLRSTPCNRIIIFSGLKYNADKKQWDGCKIYDPTRGLKANCTAAFQSDGTLKIRGSIMGIGENSIWTPVK